MREEFRVVVFCDQQAHFSDGYNLQQELKRQCTPIAMGLPVVLWVEQDNPVFQEAFQLCKKNAGQFCLEEFPKLPQEEENVRLRVADLLDRADGVVLISDVFVGEPFLEAARGAQKRRLPLRQIILLPQKGSVR